MASERSKTERYVVVFRSLKCNCRLIYSIISAFSIFAFGLNVHTNEPHKWMDALHIYGGKIGLECGIQMLHVHNSLYTEWRCWLHLSMSMRLQHFEWEQTVEKKGSNMRAKQQCWNIDLVILALLLLLLFHDGNFTGRKREKLKIFLPCNLYFYFVIVNSSRTYTHAPTVEWWFNDRQKCR